MAFAAHTFVVMPKFDFSYLVETTLSDLSLVFIILHLALIGQL